MRRWLVRALGALVIAAAIGGGGLFLRGYAAYIADGPLAAPRAVYLAPGSGVAGIARQLHTAGVIADPLVFRAAVRTRAAARRLKAGEYEFPAAISTRAVIDRLLDGRTVVRKLTIPEGLTSREAHALIAAAEGFGEGSVPVPAEGSLLPETYHYRYGDERAVLVGRMQAARAALLAEVWPGRDPALPLANPDEAVILASIVEKETGLASERERIAGVFVNRLRRGMRLQSDPTVVYGLTGGAGPLGRPLTRQDLKAPSPYNTYLNDGLPPGPIANPGRAALLAVLHPAKTKDLYFVADGSGGHAFAASLSAHQRNVRKWRQFQRQRTR